MALDTREKRVSAISVARPWLRTIFPKETKDENWRGSVGNIYPVGETVLPPGVFFLALTIK